MRLAAGYVLAGLVGAVAAVLGLAMSGRRRLERDDAPTWPGDDVAWTLDDAGRIVPMRVGAAWPAEIPRF